MALPADSITARSRLCVLRHWLHGVALWCAVTIAQAAGIDQQFPAAKQFFPQADRFDQPSGDPPAAGAYRDGALLGYVFVTTDIVKIPGYSGRPINLLVGLDVSGKITGVSVLEHQETILRSHFPKGTLERFVESYVGKSITRHVGLGVSNRPGYVNIDAVSGATVTLMAVNRTILDAARKVGNSRGIIRQPLEPHGTPATVRANLYAPADWTMLTGNGAVRRLLLTRADVERAFRGTIAEGAPDTAMDASACVELPPGEPCDVFIDMYYAYLNAPTIGRNLLGERQYADLMAGLKPGEHAIAVMANGMYSFKGTAYVHGGVFDRIQLVQGERTVSFRDADYERLDDPVLPGMPGFAERAIFTIRSDAHLDPGASWALELRVRRQVGARQGASVTFSADYQIPGAYVKHPNEHADRGPRRGER